MLNDKRKSINKFYFCIDLKSFYASVECVKRGLDPLITNLVVADVSRTNKTICLAVSPSLKELGISGRARLYEVVKAVKEENNRRKNELKNEFEGKSFNSLELRNNPKLEIDYIIAPPRMSSYIEYSAKIYSIYLKYFSKDDIHVYSIDEVFCDVSNYLRLYKCSPKELVIRVLKDIFDTTGITATAGIGTNLYLAKVAMDIIAKHTEANEFGVRVASLDIESYRKKLWTHVPLTDFWRIGKGYYNKLKEYKIYTMGDIARTSIENEDLLYKLFGIDAELLIDHAWGVEPCTIEDIKKYKPKSSSLSSSQVLHFPYDFWKAKVIVKEMTDLLTLDLIKNKLFTKQISMTIHYDVSNITNGRSIFNNENTSLDSYNRVVPKPNHGSINLESYTASFSLLLENSLKLYESITNRKLLIRKISISFNNLIDDTFAKTKRIDQISLFDSFSKLDANYLEKEEKLQQTLLELKIKYGKNSILKAMDLEEGATTKERNEEIGGHKT